MSPLDAFSFYDLKNKITSAVLPGKWEAVRMFVVQFYSIVLRQTPYPNLDLKKNFWNIKHTF